MSICILFNQKETETWFLKLKELLPNKLIKVYPDVSDKSKVEFLITWKPHQDYANEFPNLKVVQSVGAGVDNLLHTALNDDIIVTRIVDPNLKQDMYEHVLSCIMSSIKNVIPYFQNQLDKNWEPRKYKSINETTITILGLGEIGKFVAEKLHALGFIVKGWSNSKKEIDGIQCFNGDLGLFEAINFTDIVVNILPLTPLTERILNQDFFNKLKDQTVLVNVARGGHLIDNDLLEAFRNGKIKEAYLDVFNQEPLLIDHPFWQHPNIYITPHVASITNPETAIEQVVENILRLENNTDLINQVDLKRGY